MPSTWVDLLGIELRRVGQRFQGRCAVAGSGEPLILLHGQGGHLENFSRNIAELAQHYRVYAPDAAWHGLGPRPSFDASLVPTFVDQVLDLMDSEGLESAHIEGQSMGGWTAMRLALREPERLRSLTLVTPQGFHFEPSEGVPGFEPTPGVELRDHQLGVLREPTESSIRSRLRGLFANPDRIPDEMVQTRLALYRRPEVNQSLQQVVEAYMAGPESACRAFVVDEEQLASIKVPTLVYWGETNPIPPAVGEQLATLIPGAQYFCADDVGHWAQYEDAATHNRVVLNFLGSV